MHDERNGKESEAAESAVSKRLRIVLLGDLHVYRLWTWPWHLFSKRILGQANLWLNRRSKFDLDRLPSLVEQVGKLNPTLVLQLGDLTTTAMVSEFKLAARYLEPLMRKVDLLFLVPGNHDRYTFISSFDRRFERYFGKYAPSHYPWTRKLADGLFLVALDPTRPRILDASGKLGSRQLERLQQLLSELPEKASVIVACHYPIGSPPGFPPEGRNHRLHDIPELLQVLARSGRDVLYVHGHVHQPWCWRMKEYPKIVTINAGAPVMLDPLHPLGQGFWQIDATGDRQEPWQLSRHLARTAGEWTRRTSRWPGEPGQIAAIS